MRLQRYFEEPGVERAFLRSERRARGQAIRALSIVAIVTLFGYLLINPIHLPRDGVIAYSVAAGALIVLLIGFILLTRSEFYLDTPWIDLPLFIAFAAAMKGLTLALASQSAVTGIPPHAMALVQMAILLIFASVGFAATFRFYWPWALAVFALFAAWLATQQLPAIARLYTLTNFSTFFLFALYFNWVLEYRARSVFAARRALDAERAKTEALLYSVLPQPVAERLRAGETVADSFADATIVFVDLVDFSLLSRKVSPGHLVRLLAEYFSAADRCAERHGLEKVKTIGDAYLAVAGGMSSRGAGSREALAFARSLVADISAIDTGVGQPLKARIGIHTGPVVGGVIGTTRLVYDYWGETMNVASRLQGAAPDNGVAVSETSYFQLRDAAEFEPKQAELKGIGKTNIYSARLAGSDE